MAVNLLGSSDAKVQFGDLAMGDRGKFTVALTFKPTASPANRRLAHQWNGPSGAWIITVENTDELALTVTNGANNYYQRITTTLNLANGTTYSMVARWKGNSSGGPEWKLWINGSEITLSNGFEVSSFQAMNNSTAQVELGFETGESLDGLDADYAEFALWTEALSDAICADLSASRLPGCYESETGALLYWKGTNTSDTTDHFGSATIVHSNSTTATHPTMVECSGTVLRGAVSGGVTLRGIVSVA